MKRPAAVVLLITVLVSGVTAGILRWTEPVPVWPDTAGTDTLWQAGPVLAGNDTALWAIWRQTKGDSSHIKATCHNGEQWLPPVSVFHGTRDNPPYFLRLTLDREQEPWVVYDFVDSTGANLLYSRRWGDTWTHPALINRDSRRGPHDPGLGAHPQGGVQVAWVRGGAQEVWLFTARGTEDSWTTPVMIDAAEAIMVMRSPTVAAINDSQMMVVWPACRDLVHTPLWSMVGSGDSWTEPVAVAFPPGGTEYPAQLTVTQTGPGAGDVRLFWHRNSHGIQTARYDYDGEKWVEPLQLDPECTGNPVACTDEYGWTWVSHYNQLGDYWRSVVRYHDGTAWSEPMPHTDTALAIVGLAAAHGRIWAMMGGYEAYPGQMLYYSSAAHPLAVAEPGQTPVRQPSGPTIIRGVLTLPRRGAGHDPGSENRSGSCPALLLNISGRKVMELQPGDNDVRHLAPGVYFIRAEGASGQGFDGSSRKVVIQR
ncbi:MAG: T9SS type A sorting domain-containing protein [bacterium]